MRQKLLAAGTACLLVAGGATVGGAFHGGEGMAEAVPVLAAAPAHRPEPHVMNFAHQLTGPKRQGRGGNKPVPLAPETDGCDHAYGEPQQCVPWTFPRDAPADRCEWLGPRKLGDKKLKKARDRHKLDRNKDGIACGPGD